MDELELLNIEAFNTLVGEHESDTVQADTALLLALTTHLNLRIVNQGNKQIAFEEV